MDSGTALLGALQGMSMWSAFTTPYRELRDVANTPEDVALTHRGEIVAGCATLAVSGIASAVVSSPVPLLLGVATIVVLASVWEVEMARHTEMRDVRND